MQVEVPVSEFSKMYKNGNVEKDEMSILRYNNSPKKAFSVLEKQY